MSLLHLSRAHTPTRESSTAQSLPLGKAAGTAGERRAQSLQTVVWGLWCWLGLLCLCPAWASAA